MSDETKPGLCEQDDCRRPAQGPHTCPFQTEINDNYTPCTCCEHCEKDCAYDI